MAGVLYKENLEQKLKNILQTIESKLKKDYNDMPKGYGKGFRQGLVEGKCFILTLLVSEDEISKSNVEELLKTLTTEYHEYLNGKDEADDDLFYWFYDGKAQALVEIKVNIRRSIEND